MTNKVEYFNGIEVLEEMKDSFGLSDWDTVKEYLVGATSPSNFTGGRRPTLSDNHFGEIGVLEFMDEVLNEGQAMDLEELEEYFNEAETFVFKGADNTYNHGGYMERDFTWHEYENAETDEMVVFIAFHIGLDIRAGYTEFVAVKFENSYDWAEMLTNRFELAFASFYIDGKEYTIGIDGEGISEYTSVYISDEGNNEYSENYDTEPYLDLFDKETAIESIADYLKENDINYDTDKGITITD